MAQRKSLQLQTLNMSTLVNSIIVLADSAVEPVSITDARNWLKLDTAYTEDDNLIAELISSARKHIEKLTGCNLVNKSMKVLINAYGQPMNPTYVVDLPYGPVVCVDLVRLKAGINTYDTLTKNTHYEVIGGRLWLYSPGDYEVTYTSGYGDCPADLETDILTLVAWSYENRGKKMEGQGREGLLRNYPNWDGMNYHQYKKVVI